jgi:heat-inducible transcriptional repressor
MPIYNLTETETKILQAVVDLYVRDGSPVSSLKIKQATGVSMSTATIRNILARLEKNGLLAKPHTSAGRIPTDEGYRAVVDTIRPDQSLVAKISALFREQIREQRDIGAIMSHASKLLGHLSRNFAVVYGSVLQESRVRRINLLELEGSRVLVVLHLMPEYERTTTVYLDSRCAPHIIRRAEELINPIIHDRTLDEAKEALDCAVRDNITDEGRIMGIVALNREIIFNDPPAVELFFEEREHLFEQPELSDPALLHLLLRMLHDKEYLTSILSTRLAERTMITIGAENNEEVLRPFSLVTSGYRMGGSRGVLGIIGPTRMRYGYTCSLVGSIARELRAIGEEIY